MARLQRFCPAGVAEHIIQRGNDRQACFAAEEDFIIYAGLLKQYADEFNVSIHAWVLMTNHVHLLATPDTEIALGKTSTIRKPLPIYTGLGQNDKLRREAYRVLFNEQLNEKTLTAIRDAVNKGLALGTERFKDEIEHLHGRRVTAAKMGRPKKKKAWYCFESFI